MDDLGGTPAIFGNIYFNEPRKFMKIPSSSISSTSATAGLNACGGGSSTGDSAFASSMTTFVDPLDFEGILLECHGIPILGSLIECSGRSFNQFYVTYILLLKTLSIHKPCNISISKLKHRFEMTENICNEYPQMQNKSSDSIYLQRLFVALSCVWTV